MSLFDIYKAKKLGINTNSMFASVAGKKLNKDAWKKGFNKWDEEWELGDLRSDNGGNYPATNRIRSKNYIPLLPDTTYYFKSPNNSFFCFYDADKKYTNIGNNTIYGNATFTTKENTHFMRISLSPSYGTVYNNDICINVSGEHDGEYVPYNGE